jgi:hyperosmotically inducible periplasmic protein
MKNLSRIGILSAIVLLAGCERSPDSGLSTDAGAQRQASSEQDAGDLTATSRATGVENNYETTNSAAGMQPDNTGINVRDRDDASLTPGDQGNSESDREITRRIRRAITSNEQLSTTAKNIKIITIDGKVTVRGPVKNEQERESIAAIVQQTGASAVDNQLEVKTNN